MRSMKVALLALLLACGGLAHAAPSAQEILAASDAVRGAGGQQGFRPSFITVEVIGLGD